MIDSYPHRVDDHLRFDVPVNCFWLGHAGQYKNLLQPVKKEIYARKKSWVHRSGRGWVDPDATKGLLLLA